jgi:hypothetical protein
MTSENVTVLLTDMVGSTALVSSLEPANADELRRTHPAAPRGDLLGAGVTPVRLGRHLRVGVESEHRPAGGQREPGTDIAERIDVAPRRP